MVDIKFKETSPAWASFYSTSGKVIFEDEAVIHVLTEQVGTGKKITFTFHKEYIQTIKRSN